MGYSAARSTSRPKDNDGQQVTRLRLSSERTRAHADSADAGQPEIAQEQHVMMHWALEFFPFHPAFPFVSFLISRLRSHFINTTDQCRTIGSVYVMSSCYKHMSFRLRLFLPKVPI
jgi:hypothetical protein